jgi:hypothetical protein
VAYLHSPERIFVASVAPSVIKDISTSITMMTEIIVKNLILRHNRPKKDDIGELHLDNMIRCNK